MGNAVYITVIIMNIFRPGNDIVELAKEFGRTYFAIFIILAVYHYVKSNKENLLKLTRYLSYMLNIVAFIGIIQYVTKFGGLFAEGFYRSRGTFFNFNEFAYVISIFICFALYFLLIPKLSDIGFTGLQP